MGMEERKFLRGQRRMLVTTIIAVVGATILGAALFLALWRTKPNGYGDNEG